MASGWHRRPRTQAELDRRKVYNSTEHKAQVAKARATRDSGHGHCWRCGRWLDPRKPVHAGHDDHDRSVYRGAECAPCNLKAAARKGNRMSNAKQSARRNGLSARLPRPESAPTPAPRW